MYPFYPKKRKHFFNISTLALCLALLPAALPAAHHPPNYSLKLDYTPLFPGIQRLTLGVLPPYGEVVAAWQHTDRRSFLYVYRLSGGKLRRLGRALALPPGTPPCVSFMGGGLWVTLGPASIGRLALRGGEWFAARQFSAGSNVTALGALDDALIAAIADKPGWSRLTLFSPGGEKIWSDRKIWNGRGFGFARGGGRLWVSVDEWDGISSTLAIYAVAKSGGKPALAFQSSYSDSGFETGKILLSGYGELNGKPVAAASVWILSRYGVKRRDAFFVLGPRRLEAMGATLPFTDEKLAAVLPMAGGMDLLIQYEPNKETIAPMAVSIFHLGRSYVGWRESAPDVAGSLKFFMSKRTRVRPGAAGRGSFKPEKYRALLQPWQWEEWRAHVAKSGHEGIAGVSDPDQYPYAHGWPAISDPNPKHTVWACDATPADYLAGRVKGTEWAYIPFDADLREPICERCHPIRSGKPTIWSMYNAKLKGNQLTPDGLRAPEQ